MAMAKAMAMAMVLRYRSEIWPSWWVGVGEMRMMMCVLSVNLV